LQHDQENYARTAMAMIETWVEGANPDWVSRPLMNWVKVSRLSWRKVSEFRRWLNELME
jgi:hypothetical protein